jgi:hypothetical protein
MITKTGNHAPDLVKPRGQVAENILAKVSELKCNQQFCFDFARRTLSDREEVCKLLRRFPPCPLRNVCCDRNRRTTDLTGQAKLFVAGKAIPSPCTLER